MFEAVVGELIIGSDDILVDSLGEARNRIFNMYRTAEGLARLLRMGEEHIDEREFFKAVMSSNDYFVAWEELRRMFADERDALTFVDPGLGINRATEQSFLSTTEYQIIGHAVEGRGLDNLTLFSAVLGGGWIDPRDHTRAHIYSHKASTGELSIQLQVKCTDYLKCVHLVLAQIGRDLIARADWAAYTSVDHELGYDFEKACDKQMVPVATSAGADGYGVSGLYLYYTTHSWC